MATFDFEPHLAIDESGNQAINSVAQVYSYTDTTFATPLEITDLAGVVIPTFVSTDLGVFPPFQTIDEPLVRLVSGPYIATLASVGGLRDEAVAARLASEAAQLAAQDAATRAEAAQAAAEDARDGTVGGGSGVGNIIAMPFWDGTGSQPARVYPVGHALAGLDIPDAPEVFVQWCQATFPTGVSQEGDRLLRVLA